MPRQAPVFSPRHQAQTSTTGCRCCISTAGRVAPVPGPCSGNLIIEIRPDRYLRVCHINPMRRDSAFEKQLQRRKERSRSSKSVRSTQLLRIQRQKTKQHIVRHTADTDNDTVEKSKTEDSSTSPKIEYQTRTLENGGVVQLNRDFLRDKLRERTRTASSVDVKLPADASTDVPSSSLPHQSANVGDVPRQQQTNSHSSSEGDNTAAIFMIHGVGGCADVWQAQIDYFARQGYEIIAPDLIGHGFSSTPSNPHAYHFNEIAEDVLEIFDRFCKPRNIVIGHSYGCSFAAVLARKRQRFVSKLIFISGGSPTPLAPQPGVFASPLCFLACVRPILERTFKKNAFHQQSKTYVPQEKTFDIPTYVLKAVMNGQDWMDGDAEYHQWLSTQVLLIHGREDGLVSIDDELEMKQAIYGSVLEIVNEASHMVMIEKPQEVNNLIHDFLLSVFPLIGSSANNAQAKRLVVSKHDARVTRNDTRHSALSLSSFKSLSDASELT